MLIPHALNCPKSQQGYEAAVRAVPQPPRGAVSGPLLRPGLRALVPELRVQRSPHHPHPALGGGGQPRPLAHSRYTDNLTQIFYAHRVIMTLRSMPYEVVKHDNHHDCVLHELAYHR